MKNKLICLCLIAMTWCALQAQNDQLRIAIFDPASSGAAIDEGTAIAVRELISSVFVNMGKYTIVERSLLEKVMSEQAFSNSGAVDDSQASEIGRLAGANKIVLSVVTQAENSNVLSIKLVDVNTATVEQQKTRVIAANRILEFVEPLTLDMLGETAVYPSATSQPPGQINTAQQPSAVRNGGNVGSHPSEPEMVFVQGGTFAMGSPKSERGRSKDETQHSVTLNDFYIGKYEVTQALWREVMGTTVSQQRDSHSFRILPITGEGDNYPMYYVSWDEAQEFIRRLNAATGKTYRLPTEAEWEFAARGGTKSQGYTYSGSNELGNVAWYMDNSENSTHPVGTKSSNELGIYDMCGNVMEWCSDWFGSYNSYTQTNPQGPSAGKYRVYRGGSWAEPTRIMRIPYRLGSQPSYGIPTVGFRLAHSSN